MAIELNVTETESASDDRIQSEQRSGTGESVREPQPLAETESRRTQSPGRNCLEMYLTEIGKLKRIGPEQERELARRIKQGDAEAREEMIKANLRLVVKLARDYEHLGVPLLDLISEGNIGLIKAAERFDESFGTRFSTYACWYIRQTIRAGLDRQARTIRLPSHVLSRIWKINRTAAQLRQLLGRDPTDEELASELEMDAPRVAELRQAEVQPMSLDLPISEDGTCTLGETVGDDNGETADQMANRHVVARLFADMSRHLTKREAELVRARFGLDGSSPKGLHELSERFGVSRERVRQVLNNALTRLRKLVIRVDGRANGIGCTV
jgi:RNA polymerase primary sigma factor